MTESQVTLPIDTCIFLHFKAFTQINWRQMANADRVILAICHKVIDELDKFTHDPRLADRARRSLKEIVENENKEFQEGVTLIIFDDLRRQDFPSEMDPEQNDNHVIRSAQVYLERHPKETVMIVTEDTGMTVRARKAGIQCLRLPDSERLPNVDDELIRRAKKAEAELAEERTKRPDLELTAAVADAVDDQDSTDFFPPGVFQPVNVDDAMRKVRAKYPKSRSSGPSHPFDSPEYDRSLDKYYERYERCLKDRNKWLQKRGTFFSFDLFMANKGKALARNIQAEIVFPPFVRLLDGDSLFSPLDSFPFRPPPPKKSGFSDIFGHTSLIESLASPPSRASDGENATRIFLRNGENPKVTVSMVELIHSKTPNKLHTLTFWFPVGELPRRFGASCSILSAELPKSLQQTLVFEV